jgi:mycofactocin biosynthesis protein MftB
VGPLPFIARTDGNVGVVQASSPVLSNSVASNSDASGDHIPTDAMTPVPAVALIDPLRPYALHPSVAVRPEPFGALVYHYGNRKLVFLKSPRVVTVVQSLAGHSSLDAALGAARVPATARDRYLAALQSLLASDMIVPVADAAVATNTATNTAMDTAQDTSKGSSDGTVG